MNKVIPLMFIMFLLVVPMVVAEIELTIPFNQQYDLKRPCFNNGTFCSAQAVCNVTIAYPNGGILTNNQQMTNQLSFHNVTLTNFNISELGVMSTFMVCTDPAGSINGSSFDTFEISVTGDGFKSLPFPLEFTVIAFAFILIGVSYTTDRLTILRRIGGILAMVMGVVTMYPGYANFNYSTLQGQALGVANIGLGFFFLIADSFSFDRQVDHYDQADDGRFHDFG